MTSSSSFNNNATINSSNNNNNIHNANNNNTNNNNNDNNIPSSHQANINGMIRYAQLKDTTNHQSLVQSSQNSLMVEKMNELSHLLQEIQDTDWMYEKTNNYNNHDDVVVGGGGSGMMKKPACLNRGLDEGF